MVYRQEPVSHQQYSETLCDYSFAVFKPKDGKPNFYEDPHM